MPAHHLRTASVVLCGASLASIALIGATSQASAANTGGTTLKAVVSSAISISLDSVDQSAVLRGAVNSTATTPDGTVSLIVTTNDPAGYTMSVTADQTYLLPPNTTINKDKIPFSALTATAVGGSTVNLGTGGLVYSKATQSNVAGDEHRVSFSATLPFANSDKYTGSVSFTATAN